MKVTPGILILVIVSLFSKAVGLDSTQNSYKPIREYSNQSIFDIENITEENIDIGLWTLLIDKEIDSTIDVEYYLGRLEEMATEIKRMVASRDGDMVRFVMTKMYQYDSGVWNDFRPYTYDFDDPLGEKLKNKMLSTYIDTRKGNCVTMPTLFLALMERVDPDIPIFGVRLPLHLFCRFYDRDTGKIWNVETTNGGSANRDEWYIEQFGLTDEQINSGIYLGDMGKKEYITEAMGVLVSKCRDEQDYDKGLEFTEIMLRINPKSISGLVLKGAMLSWKGYTLYENIKEQGRQPTIDEHKILSFYEGESNRYIDSAKSLGWSPQSDEARDNYLKMIEQEKARINNSGG